MTQATSLRTRPRADWIPATMAFVIGLAAWQLFVSLDLGRVELPGPFDLVRELAAFGTSSEFWIAALGSGRVFIQGIVPAVVVGVGVGLLIGSVGWLDRAFGPLLFAVYSTPFIALVPLFLVAFGFGVFSKSMIVFFLVFMTVVLQTIAGVRNVDRGIIEVAASFRAPRRRRIGELLLPGALPFIVAGVRLGIGRGLVGVVVAEFETAITGLGGLILRYSQNLQLAKATIPAIFLASIGVILTSYLRRFETRLEAWKH